MLMSDHLKKTEKKLVTLFVTGIILFLVLFEGIFLASRYFLERDAHEEGFLVDTEHIL